MVAKKWLLKNAKKDLCKKKLKNAKKDCAKKDC